ncbi:MAG: virulence-associated protein E [Rhodobacteraceae bacterium]|nr:MAG: virulence-associated protein E [Paracoccaceae bacterium]
MTEAHNLTQALGGEWRGHSGNAPCPVCQPERRTDQRGLSIRAEGGALLAFCHKSGCDFRDIVRAAGLPRDALRIDPKAARETDAKREAYAAEQLAKARRLWASCKPLAGTMGEAYLRGRGITCPLPPSLGWAADAFHAPSARWLSAMVGDVSTGGVHRTYFEKTGGRIGGNAKMMQGPCAGGAVALSEGQGPLVVCEGIETGLSLMSGLLASPATVWAALSTSGMKALALPSAPGEIVIATDSDDAGAGWAAGIALAERAAARGWAVSLWPAPEGQDWNDALRAGVAA